jgi:glycosyltransferase involved in cell wall biosynthesis
VTGETALVSVIMPAFNAAQWIRESISSVINQSYPHLEIIVVDDGSADNTSLAVAEFTDPRIHLISQSRNGAASARNAGMAIATGSYIQFLDADDLLSDRKIERQINALTSEPDSSVASCEWVHLENGRIRKPDQHAVWKVCDPIEWLVQSLRGGGMMQPAGWLTPRNVIDRAGLWNESLTLHDDGDFFARVLANASSNVFVEDATVLYRDNPRGLSRQRSRKAAESAFAVCESRQAVIAARRSDHDALTAIATQYAQFAYEFALSAPDLASKAMQNIEALRVPVEPVLGGRFFKILTRAAGFPTAMGIRRIIQRAGA